MTAPFDVSNDGNLRWLILVTKQPAKLEVLKCTLWFDWHTVKPTQRFQNTTRRFPKFPRTHRGDILLFVVVAKKHCAQILATMRALLYACNAGEILKKIHQKDDILNK